MKNKNISIDITNINVYLPYLPYVENLNYLCDYVGVQYSQLTSLYPIFKDNNVLDWYYKTDAGNRASINDCKLILRHLKDLNTTMQYQEKEFVPWVELRYLFGTFHQLEYRSQFKSVYIDFGDHVSGFNLNYDAMPIINELYKWHFDLHGLIDSGLAIDIKTLDKSIFETI